MSITIRYEHTFNYFVLPTGKRRPGLLIQIRNGGVQLDTKAFLDSGAEYSLFTGKFAPALGLDLIAGRPRAYRTINNTVINGYVHPVSVYVPEVGEFPIQLGFSLHQITTNILGRDFFDLVKIGFDEHEQVFHLSVRQ